ncbi:MAG: FAD-dependent oxidoreductase [Nocardioides sp.]
MTGPMTGPTTGPTWASDPLARNDGRPWDLLIVGGGTAGLVAAQTAAGFGARVLLVERERTGGDCLWTGCVPSKSLLAAAHVAAEARNGERLGVSVGSVSVDFDAVMAHVHDAIATIAPIDSPEHLREAGVSVAQATVRFTGRGRADVDGTEVRFDQALLATGSAPVVPDLPGLRDCDPLTSDTVWDLSELPSRLLVLGGGPIGCELGQALARLGSRVTVVEAGDRLLSRETAAASAAVLRSLEHDGVDVRVGVSLERAEPYSGGLIAHLDNGDHVEADRVLVAVGRRPRTADLGLELLGVDLDDRGFVTVDARLRTSNPRVWAAGDLTGHPPFTHVAGVHGSLAASNAVLGLRRAVAPDLVPRVTYTQPEVAAFGLSPDDAPDDHLVRTIEHTEVDRAVAEASTDGHSSLVFDGKGRVVGASIVGPRAGEMLAEAMLAGQGGERARTIAGAMHAYPAWSDGVWKAALAQARTDLDGPVVSRLTRTLARVRRGWVRRTGRG